MSVKSTTNGFNLFFLRNILPIDCCTEPIPVAITSVSKSGLSYASDAILKVAKIMSDLLDSHKSEELCVTVKSPNKYLPFLSNSNP